MVRSRSAVQFRPTAQEREMVIKKSKRISCGYHLIWYNTVMATIKNRQIQSIRRLYSKKGLSVREIALHYKVSQNAVFYFMRKHKIARRDPSAANNMTFKRKPLNFQLKQKLTPNEVKIKVAALMLYWAEGAKWEGGVVVDFANSDARMIKIFMKFLLDICGVKKERIRGYLYCYSNQNPNRLIKYWSKAVNLPVKQFTKPYIRADYLPGKETKMPYGLFHIRYNDKKLLLLIQDWIRESVNDLGVDGGAVNRTRL